MATGTRIPFTPPEEPTNREAAPSSSSPADRETNASAQPISMPIPIPNSSQNSHLSSLSPLSSLSSPSSSQAPRRPACAICRVRVNLAQSLANHCHKCHNCYCEQHRLPEAHNCPHDFRTAGREQLSKSNPAVIKERLQRF